MLRFGETKIEKEKFSAARTPKKNVNVDYVKC